MGQAQEKVIPMKKSKSKPKPSEGIKNSELVSMSATINNILSISTSSMPVKFVWALRKNKGLIANDVAAIEEIFKRQADFNKDRLEVCVRYCEKDKDGNPVFDDYGNYKIKYKGKFDSEILDVKEKHKKVLEEWKEFEKEKVKIKFHQIALDEFPKELPPMAVDHLIPLISEDGAFK